MDFVPAEACWTVFIVSNGASIVLEHAAARPDARVLLSPSTIAEDDAEDDDDDDDDEEGGDESDEFINFDDDDDDDDKDFGFANAAVDADGDINPP
jgi:hypothetical protein